MGVPKTLGRRAWRKYQTDGVPSTGAQDPAKNDIIAFVDATDDAISAAQVTADNALSAAQGGIVPNHDDVRLATTVAVSPTTGMENGDTYDGIVLVTGDRILRNAATDQANNGVWLVPASGAASRVSDMNVDTEFVGAKFYVKEGTSAGKTYGVQQKLPITVGTTAITFSTIADNADLVPTLGVVRSQRAALQQLPRSGANTGEHQALDALISARVDGAQPGEVWQLAYYGNDFTSTGIILYVWPSESDFSSGTTTNRTLAQNYTDQDFDIPTDRISTLTFNPTNRRETTVTLVWDGTKLPTSGTPVKATELSDPGSTYVINPAMVFAAGTVLPDTMIKLSRAGASAAPHQALAALIGANVTGAEDGEVVQFSYYGNNFGNTGIIIYGWSSQSDFIADTGRYLIHNYVDQSFSIPYDQISTINFVPHYRPEMEITLVFDGTKLPPSGTPVKAVELTDPGSAYIINPAYVGDGSGAAPSTNALASGSMYWTYNTSTQAVSFASQYGIDTMLRVTIAPDTYNSLPTIRSIQKAPLGDPAAATWSTIMSSSGGDFWPPLVFNVTSGGDGSSVAYTGGNHGSTGGLGGVPTAELDTYAVTVNGIDVTVLGESGYASEIVIAWSNLIQAYNTRTTIPPRYALRQDFTARITSLSIESMCKCTALEALVMQRDNGLQLVGTGYLDFLHFWDGEGHAKIADWSNTGSHDSGDFGSWPTARIAVASDDVNGHLVSWMDPNFGICADADAIASTEPAMYQPGTGKVYQTATYNPGNGYWPLASGASYEWRGGYSFAPTDMASGDIESAFRRTLAGRVQYLAILTAAGDGIVRTLVGERGQSIDVAPYAIGADGWATTAAGYQVNTATVFGVDTSAFDSRLDTAEADITALQAATSAMKSGGMLFVTDPLYGSVDLTGVASSQTAVAAAVAAAYAAGAVLFWPAGTYLTTASIPNFHDVRHFGTGIVKRGSDLFPIYQKSTTTNFLYLSASGNDANDGLTSSQPLDTLGQAFVILSHYGPFLDGDWWIKIANGTYSEQIVFPIGLRSRLPVKIVATSSPGASPAVPTVIFDGTGKGTSTVMSFARNAYITIRNIKFQDWQGPAIRATDYSQLNLENVHFDNCGYTSSYALAVNNWTFLVISGGVYNEPTGTSDGAIQIINQSWVDIGYTYVEASRNLTADASTTVGPQFYGSNSGNTVGIQFTEGSRGHVHCATLDNFNYGISISHSRCHLDASIISNNDIAGVSVGHESQFFDNHATPNTYTGNLANIVTQGSGMDVYRMPLAARMPYVLSTPVTWSLTGTTSTTTLGTVYTLDGVEFNPGDYIEIFVTGFITGTAGTKSLQVRGAGSAQFTGAATTMAASPAGYFEATFRITCDATKNTQYNNSKSLVRLGAIDAANGTTSQLLTNGTSVPVYISGVLGNAADTIAISRVVVTRCG
jgi:hypothetical protein